MTVIVTCRTCGQEFAPDHSAIVAGSWRTCPACRPAPTETRRCTACGRVLRAGTRDVCLSCAGLSVV